MIEKDVTSKISDYISKNHLSTKKIAQDTQIEEKKLYVNSGEVLNAAEFLELCAYLQIRPEEYIDK